jgi:hypothetical protein
LSDIPEELGEMTIGATRRPRRQRVARGRPYRRTAVAAVIVLLAWALTWLATSHAGAATDAGQGSAAAFTDRFDPRAGSLSIGITFGAALAGHQNSQAKAQSQAIDLGVIGTSLTGYNCGKPPQFSSDQLPGPLIVESGEPGADTGKTENDVGGGATKFGQANATPFSKAITKTGPVGLAGVLEIGGGTATSYSGLVNGVRVAGATTDISGITLPGNVVLSSLHWETAFPTTGGGQPTGSFSIGHASAAGVPLPVDPTTSIGQINAILGALGMVITPPTVHLTQGTMYVDPMGISVIPNATRDAISGAVLAGLQPVTSQLFAAVLQAYCEADTELTVAQIAIGAITGAGSFNVTLGGVQSSSGTIAANGFNLGTSGFQPGTAAVAGLPAASASSGLGAATAGVTGGLGASPAVAAPSSALLIPAAPSPSIRSPLKALSGKRGGALATVGLGGLGLLGLLAEGDRRKMRHAQRTVTFEE